MLLYRIEEFFKKPFTSWLLIASGVLIPLIRYIHFETQSPYLLTLGRFHPMILHFPIAMLFILLLCEVGRVYLAVQIEHTWTLFGFVFSILLVSITIKTGIMLYASGEYSGILLDQHFTGALISGTLIFISFGLYLLYIRNPKIYPVYYTGLILSNMVILYTGHQGASMTHGKNYLSGYFPMMFTKSSGTQTPDTTSYFYADVLQPILDMKCAGCHNGTRSKGGLIITIYKDLFKKGDSGNPGITPHDTSSSEIYRRIMLPDSSDEHMSPQGKTALTKDEITLLRFWISANALENIKTSDITYAPIKNKILQLAPTINKYKLNIEKEKFTQIKINQDLMFLSKEIEMKITKDEKDENNLYTLSNYFPPSPFDSKKLRELKPYLDRFSKVSLVSSQMDDADLYLISQMDNVRELYLQKTRIKGFGLVQLARLKNLEILNVSFTDTDDQALIDILKFPALKELYLYGTRTTKDVILAIEKNKKGLKIYSEEGPYF